MPNQQDYYSRLGVNRNATDDDIKRAFGESAKKLHPDVNKEEDVEEKFKDINEAYQVLSNAKKRQEYDALGQTRFEEKEKGANMTANMGFEEMFNNFIRGQGFFDFGFWGTSQQSKTNNIVTIPENDWGASCGIEKSI